MKKSSRNTADCPPSPRLRRGRHGWRR